MTQPEQLSNMTVFTQQVAESVARTEPDFLQPTEIEKKLLELRINKVEPHRGGSNTVLLVTLDQNIQAIAKPGRSENPLYDFPEAQYRLYRRERSAWLVDKMLGLNIIPPTVVREIRGDESSLQLFVRDCLTAYETEHIEGCEESLHLMALIDLLIWNRDRKPANFLIDPTQKIHAIDNGLSFDNWEGNVFRNWLLLNLRQYANQRRTPAKLIESLTALNERVALQDALKSQLTSLLPQPTIEAFFARAKHLGTTLTSTNGITDLDALVGESGRLLYNPQENI